MPHFSVITPTYNRAYILPEAINSILNQTYSDWEMFIVDDGSRDNTKDVVAAFKDDRITYVYQANSGPSAARNTALEKAHGRWIVYLDSDNDLLPQYFERMFDHLHDHPQTLYALPKGHRYLELYQNGTMVKRIDDSVDFPEELTVKDVFMRKIHIDCNGFLHARSLIEEGFRWDESIRHMEDWDYFMKIAERYPTRFLYVKEVLSNYYQRFGTDGIVGTSDYNDWAEAFKVIYQKHKHDKLLEGQTWYPAKVQQYLKMHEDYAQGLISSPQMRYFVE